MKYVQLFLIGLWGVFSGYWINMKLLDISPEQDIEKEKMKTSYNRCIRDGFKDYQCKSWTK